MKKYYGLWLLLSRKDNKLLQPLIKKLSLIHSDGNKFIPHLSTTNSRLTTKGDAIRSIDKYFKKTKSFKIFTDKISYSKKWSKTLFIQIKDNHRLTKISSHFSIYLGSSHDQYIFNPHISLIYNEKLNTKTKIQIIKNLEIPKSFTISGTALVYPGNKNDKWRDYSKWKIVYKKLFS